MPIKYNKVSDLESKAKSSFGPSILGESYQFTNLNEYLVSLPGWEPTYLGTAKTAHTNLDEVATNLNLLYNSSLLGTDNYAFCFYMNTPFTTENITQSNITGISVMALNSNNKMEHSYLEVTESGSLVEKVEYKVEYSELSLPDLNILLYESNGGRIAEASQFYVSSDDFASLSSSHFTERALTKTVIDNSDYLSVAGGGSGYNCSICNKQLDFQCTTRGGGGSFHCPRPRDEICPDYALSSLSVSGSEHDKDATIPSSIAYSFRDNVMANSTLGVTYINYYAQLSDIVNAFETLDAESFVDHFEFATDMYTIANRMMDETNNVIVIDTEIKNSAIAFITDYRTVTSNAEYQEILDNIEADMNHFHGMLRSEIEAELNN